MIRSFQTAMRRSARDSKIGVVEEGTIGDESVGGLVSVCER